MMGLENLLKKDKYLILSVILFFTIIYSFIGISKHMQFQTFAWDTAFFDQQAYFIKDFKVPYTSLGKMNGLGDHFHIAFLVFSFIGYKIWSNVSMLFIIQSIVICLSAWPLYLISKEVLSKTNFQEYQIKILGLLVSICYLGSVAFQGMALDEFHNDPLATLPLLWLFYFLVKKNSWGYFVSLAWLFLTKETYGLFAVPFGAYLFLTTNQYKKAWLTIILGLLVFGILIYKVMPGFAGLDEYFHFNDTNRPSTVLLKIFIEPSTAITRLIDMPEKREVIVNSFYSYGFLPLLSPTNLIMPFFSLAIRFYDESTGILYRYNNHYSVPLMSFMAVAMVYGILNAIKILSKRIKLNYLFWGLASYLLFIVISQTLIWNGPVNSIFKKEFYQRASWEKDAHELIKQVPIGKIIASQNSLLPHLSQRDNFFLLPEIGNAEYIAADLADGPNKFSPSNQLEVRKLIDEVVAKGEYKIIWQKGEAILLERMEMSLVDKGSNSGLHP